ncbi:MAG: Gfo/Idh/MocA family oxidoreductase [bacterium]
MLKGSGLKFGLIGAGSMGKNHARIAASLPGLRFVGVADANLETAKAMGEEYGIKSFANFHELLPEVDALSIVTPAAAHFEVASACIAAGKHLLIEKPFTGASSLARTLVHQAKEKNVLVQVGMIERFNPAFVRLVKEIKGEKIIGVDLKRFSPFPERISDANVIFDMMFHDLDLLLALLPGEIEAVKAKGEKIRTKKLDRVVATVTYKTGTIARIDANRVFDSKVRKLAVTTDKSFIEADLLAKTVYIRDFSSPTPSALPVKPVDQLTEELKSFSLAVKNQTPPPVTAEGALNVIMLAEEIEKAC